MAPTGESSNPDVVQQPDKEAPRQETQVESFGKTFDQAKDVVEQRQAQQQQETRQGTGQVLEVGKKIKGEIAARGELPEQVVSDLAAVDSEAASLPAQEAVAMKPIVDQMRQLEASRKGATPEQQRAIDQQLETLAKQRKEGVSEIPVAEDAPPVADKGEPKAPEKPADVLKAVENDMRRLEASRKGATSDEQRVIDQKMEALSQQQKDLVAKAAAEPKVPEAAKGDVPKPQEKPAEALKKVEADMRRLEASRKGATREQQLTIDQQMEELTQKQQKLVKENPTLGIEAQMRQLEAARKKATPEEKNAIDQKMEVLAKKQQELMKEKEAKAAAEKEKVPEKSAQETQMEEAGQKMAKIEAQVKKFEGLGMAKLLTKGGRDQRAELLKELEAVQAEYKDLRAKVVGGKVDKMLEEGVRQEIARLKAIEAEKRWDQKAATKIYDSYKKLGELNLTKVVNPTKRWSKIFCRAASVRTAISLGLMGVGFAAGATAAVGIGAIAARRVLAGMGTAFGSYDVMRMSADRKADKFSDKDLGKMGSAEVVRRMETMEVKAQMAGGTAKENEQYKKLQAKLGELVGGKKAEASAETDKAEQEKAEANAAKVDSKLADLLAEVDTKHEEFQKKSARADKIRKGLALGIGVLVGSGAVAKAVRNVREAAGWVPEKAPLPAGVAGATQEMQPPAGAASELPPESAVCDANGQIAVEQGPPPSLKELVSDKVWAASQIGKGDGYTQIFERTLKADPKSFGFDPMRDGNLDRWAHRMSVSIAKENSLLSAAREHRLVLTPDRPPGHVVLQYDQATKAFTIGKEGAVTDRLFTRPTHLDLGQGENGFKVNMAYTENGIPKHADINFHPVDQSTIENYMSQHGQLAQQLEQHGQSFKSLMTGERGEQYRKWFSAMYERQATLDRLEKMGYGHSAAARELRDHLAKDLGVIERVTASEPVKIGVPEVADQASELADRAQFDTVEKYMQVFEKRAVTREALDQLLHSPPEGSVTLTDGMGRHFTVEADDIYARAAASRELRVIHEALGKAAGGQFEYDTASGQITNFDANQLGTTFDVLKPGWSNTVDAYAQTLKGVDAWDFRQGVGGLAREISEYQKALEAMGPGNTTSPEAGFLREAIAEKSRLLAERVGKLGVIKENVPGGTVVEHGGPTAVGEQLPPKEIRVSGNMAAEQQDALVEDTSAMGRVAEQYHLNAAAHTAMVETHMTPTKVAELAKEAKDVGLTANQTILGESWFERAGNTAASRETLRNSLLDLIKKGPVGGGTGHIDIGGGRSISYATGYDSKRAAQWVLEHRLGVKLEAAPVSAVEHIEPKVPGVPVEQVVDAENAPTGLAEQGGVTNVASKVEIKTLTSGIGGSVEQLSSPHGRANFVYDAVGRIRGLQQQLEMKLGPADDAAMRSQVLREDWTQHIKGRNPSLARIQIENTARSIYAHEQMASELAKAGKAKEAAYLMQLADDMRVRASERLGDAFLGYTVGK